MGIERDPDESYFHVVIINTFDFGIFSSFYGFNLFSVFVCMCVAVSMRLLSLLQHFNVPYTFFLSLFWFLEFNSFSVDFIVDHFV